MLHLLYVTKTGPRGSLGTWKMRGLSSWCVSFQSTSQIFSFYFPKPSMAPQCLQNKVLDPRTNPNFSLLSNPLQASYLQAKPHRNCSAFGSLLVLFPLPARPLHCTTPRGPLSSEAMWLASIGLGQCTACTATPDHLPIWIIYTATPISFYLKQDFSICKWYDW